MESRTEERRGSKIYLFELKKYVGKLIPLSA